MPEDYPVSQLMSDLMSVVPGVLAYVVPAAILCGGIAFLVRWFLHAINIGDLTFGSRR